MAIQVPAIALRMNMSINYHVKRALKTDAVVRLILSMKSPEQVGHLEALCFRDIHFEELSASNGFFSGWYDFVQGEELYTHTHKFFSPYSTFC